MKINFNSIGIIHSPFKEKAGMPVQPAATAGLKGKVILDEEYIEGLADLDGFSHLPHPFFAPIERLSKCFSIQ